MNGLPFGGLDGPSRKIVVEPIEQPARTPAPDPIPETVPAAPAPKKEPVPA